MSNSIEILFNTSEITAGTRGASLGPGAILTAARKIGDTFFSNYPLNWLEDVNERLNQPPVFQYAKYIDGLTTIVDQLSVSIQDIIEKNNFPLVIAADHGSAAGTILGLKKKYPSKRLGVIWVDAHGDLHTPYTTPSGNMHGMPLAIALNEDNKDCQRNELPDELIRKWNDLKSRSGETAIKSEDLFFVGVRDTEPEEDFLIEKHKIRNFKIEEIRQGGVESLKIELDSFIESLDLLYVSFDVDSMDPDLTSYGTGTPVKNGLTPDEAKEILTFLGKQQKLVCLEFVEVNPCLDNKLNKMAEVTFELIKTSAEMIEKREWNKK